MDKQLWGADPVNGRSKWVIVDHYGPSSYTTNGEVWPPQSVMGGPNSVGLNGMQWVNGGVTEDGTYLVYPVFGGDGAVKGQIKLVWFVAATLTQVPARTDLSGSYLRLLVVGG